MPRYNSDSPNAVPVDLLAAAVVRAHQLGVPYAEIAKRCGWVRNDRKTEMGDATRLKRRLGLATYTSHGVKGRRQQFISYQNAALIARAILVDPVEVGI